ncbi:MAG: tRNA adenosine(34) deaminase TadA [Actinomycetota bacterium]|nr:tRNA adenosine(34) deaminase TadA [Actinomycetota bacterium]
MDLSSLDFDKEFMTLAIEEAQHALSKDEVPIGAVIVKDGHVVARAHNLRVAWQDVTAHAEMLALKEACERLKNWRLMGCTIYVTMEPCPMCAGAIQQARLARLVYGIADPKAGAAGSVMNIVDEPKLAHRLKITSGVEEEKCRELINIFFRRLRIRESG